MRWGWEGLDETRRGQKERGGRCGFAGRYLWVSGCGPVWVVDTSCAIMCVGLWAARHWQFKPKV